MSNESKTDGDGNRAVIAVVDHENNVISTHESPAVTVLLNGNRNNVNESGSGNGSGSGNMQSFDVNKDVDMTAKISTTDNIDIENLNEKLNTMIKEILIIVLTGHEDTAKNFIETGNIQMADINKIIHDSKPILFQMVMETQGKPQDAEKEGIKVEILITDYVNKYLCTLGVKTLIDTTGSSALSNALKKDETQIKIFVANVLGIIFSGDEISIGTNTFYIAEKGQQEYKLTTRKKEEDRNEREEENKEGNEENNEGDEGEEKGDEGEEKGDEGVKETVNENGQIGEKQTGDGGENKNEILVTIDIIKLNTCILHIINNNLMDILHTAVNMYVTKENATCKFNEKPEIGNGIAIGSWTPIKGKTKDDENSEKATPADETDAADAPADAGSDAPAADADATKKPTSNTLPPPPPTENNTQIKLDKGGGKKRRKTRKKSSSTRRRKSNRKSRKKRKQTKRKNSKKQTKRKN